MKCKKCNKKHDGSYGSGKFCSSKCAHSRVFSKESRKKLSIKSKAVKRTNEWNQKISISCKNIKLTKEQIDKRSEARRKAGYNFSKQRNQKISNALKNRILSDSHKQKLRLAMIKNIKNKKANDSQFYPNYNLKSIKVIEKYGKEHGYNFQHAENGGEFYIKELGYWVDGYDKEKNVVIEYYEKFHKYKKDKDNKRKEEIKKHLGCKFIELYE